MRDECEPGDHVWEVGPNGRLLKCTFCGKPPVPEAAEEETDFERAFRLARDIRHVPTS